jgi:hypothetical protein
MTACASVTRDPGLVCKTWSLTYRHPKPAMVAKAKAPTRAGLATICGELFFPSLLPSGGRLGVN